MTTHDDMHLLATLNDSYIPQLCALATSAALSNPGEHLVLHVIHRGLSEGSLAKLEHLGRALNMAMDPIKVDENLFQDAPQSKRYPLEMYLRLLSPHILPPSIERVIYLDPDMLVINGLRPLWETDLEGRTFAAASHTSQMETVDTVNRIRLNSTNSYMNSGLMLIDLARGRAVVKPEELFCHIRENGNLLLLPDQDVLNALYHDTILEVDDLIWNYDARHYRWYKLSTNGQADTSWVLANTSVLHFCGSPKPWQASYPWRFGMLYRHYMHLSELLIANVENG